MTRPYAELHCKTNFSFLEGASHADELIARANELGYTALAVTDRNSLAGVVRAYAAMRERAEKETATKLIIGAEITPDDAPPLVLWVTDRAAYGRLARLITVGRRRAPKGECRLSFRDVAEHAEGLIAGVLGPGPQPTSPASRPTSSATEFARIQTERTRAADHLSFGEFSSGSTNVLAAYREVFPNRCFLLAELHHGPDDARTLHRLARLSNETHLPLVAAGGVLYHAPERMPLHNVMTAIARGTTVAGADHLLNPNAQRHLRPIEDVLAVYARFPEAVRRTVEIAGQCRFSLDQLRYEYPEELVPPGMTPAGHLAQLAWQGAHRRYPHGIPEKVDTLLRHELDLIADMRYEAFFLTVWDLVRFARGRGILCQGRGSAANSAVCYCLGITAVDPEHSDVLFERFISRERDEAPDIDVDFEHERREEVLQYLYGKYGRDRCGIAATVIRYRTRSAIRDVGKALGLSPDRIDTLAGNTEGYHREPHLGERCREVGFDPESALGRRFVYLVNQLIGFPRHLSQHVGGMVITRGRLSELVPIENAAMDGRTVIQWDKDDLEELGMLKVDCLALGMLTAIAKCFRLIEEHGGPHLTLAAVPPEDRTVYDMVCRADTMGVFQIESRAQMSMLPRLRPRCFYDLVIEVAIVRPGPIQGQMVHPYLRRRHGEEKPEYPNDAVRRVLEKTLGVPLFQEQAMRLAVVAAGFTPGEADRLRRAMGAWRRQGVIERFRKKLIDGMLASGMNRQFAEAVFRQIRGFGEYGFPESHAASFALLVYVSAWLKCHHPAAFTAALLNSQPMGFYPPAQLIRNVRDHGVTVAPVDVNHSQWDCTLEPDDDRSLAIRLGFRMILGLPRMHVEALVRSRGNGVFRSIDDFTRRTRLSQSAVTLLARSDAFASIGTTRRETLWQALAQKNTARPLPLLDALDSDDDEVPAVLPAMALQEEVFADYAHTGLSLRTHPVAFVRTHLDELGVTPADRLPTVGDKRPVRVAGLVLLRQRPSTARGITFVTLEDETGAANLVIRQQTWERFRRIARAAPAWIAHGRLQHKDNVTHVVVHRLEDLSARLNRLRTKSRDFR